MKIDIFNTENKYSIIYADPPWSYRDKGCNGAAEKHYNTMDLKSIKKLPINNISDNDCILFLWCTYPFLHEGLEVIKSWGFTYKTIAFQWIKINKNGGYFFGLGRWTRGNTEPCFLAVKGKPKRINNSISQIIEYPITKHSRKPHIVRKKIIQLCGDLKKLEIFARKENGLFEDTRFDGWDIWGNEC